RQHDSPGLADHADRGLRDLGLEHSYRHHRQVGQLPAGAVDELLAHLLDVGGGQRGAQAAGHVELERVWIDRDDVLGTGEARALDGVDADAADAEHDDRVARSRLAGAHRRAPAGRHAAADQAGHFERDVVVDAHARELRHDRVVGERPQRAKAAVVLAVSMEAEGFVLEAANPGVQTAVAQVLVARRAVAALPTSRYVRGDDVVAGLHARDPRADGLDDAGAL